MKKGEWIGTYALMAAPVGAGTVPGEYIVAMPEPAEIMGVGIEGSGMIVVIAKGRDRTDVSIRKRKMLVLRDGMAIEHQYTRYIGSVNDPRLEGSAAWEHVFEVTRPNDDEESVKKDGKILLTATPGC